MIDLDAIRQLFCPCLGALTIAILVYLAWALCRIAALSDEMMNKAMKEQEEQ